VGVKPAIECTLPRSLGSTRKLLSLSFQLIPGQCLGFIIKFFLKLGRMLLVDKEFSKYIEGPRLWPVQMPVVP
jgi:hypothetical protein